MDGFTTITVLDGFMWLFVPFSILLVLMLAKWVRALFW